MSIMLPCKSPPLSTWQSLQYRPKFPFTCVNDFVSAWRLNNLHLLIGTWDVNLLYYLSIKYWIYFLIAPIGHLLKLLTNKLRILSPTHLSSVAGWPSNNSHYSCCFIFVIISISLLTMSPEGRAQSGQLLIFTEPLWYPLQFLLLSNCQPTGPWLNQRHGVIAQNYWIWWWWW